MNCPRCNTQLQTHKISELKNSFEVDVCHSCGGTWFDKGELEQIESIIDPVTIEFRKIPCSKVQFERIKCPVCWNHPRMEKAKHPRDHKVVIDVCPQCHGVWLDKGELKAIQEESWLITLAKLSRCIIDR